MASGACDAAAAGLQVTSQIGLSQNEELAAGAAMPWEVKLPVSLRSDNQNTVQRSTDLHRKLPIYSGDPSRGVCGSCSDGNGGEKEGSTAQSLPSRPFRLLQMALHWDAHAF